jgi:hypothetical protein
MNKNIKMLRKFIILFSLSTSFLKANHIAIVVDPNWRGEYAFACRIACAAKNLGWQTTLISPKKFALSSRKFTFALTLIPDEGKRQLPSLSPNYLVLFDPINHYYEEPYKIKQIYSNFFGYLTTYSGSEYLGIQNIYPEPWYPSAQYYPYKTANPKGLFYFISQWGNRLHNENHQVLQSMLGKKSYLYAFGNPNHRSIYGNRYKGTIAYDSYTLLEKIHKIGICLVLHSDLHIKYGIPSGRIFEAAAASSIIISDQNPFVIKHFQDSVLYIDEKKTGGEIFEQIDNHVNWIFSHPNEARELAKRSYQVYLHSFLLENLLISFNNWHSSRME